MLKDIKGRARRGPLHMRCAAGFLTLLAAVACVSACDRASSPGTAANDIAEAKQSAAQEVAAQFGIPVIAIATLADVLTYAGEKPELAAEYGRLLAYRERYGVQA